MYRQFYHFEHEPFAETLDPAQLFLSPGHRAALQAMRRGIEGRRGCIMLIGKAGLGKTLLLRAYMARDDQLQHQTISLGYPAVSHDNILVSLCQACGLDARVAYFPEAVAHLQRAFQEHYDHHGKSLLLILDDAQRLSTQNLENLYALLACGARPGTFLQILFAGQPELSRRLQHSAWRQVKTNMCARVTLSPLSTRDSREYIAHRLRQALPGEDTVFSNSALRKIVAYARGNPSVINSLCTEVLINGALCRQKPIAGNIAQHAMVDCAPRQSFPLLRRGVGYAYAAGVVLVAMLVWDALYWQRVWPTLHALTLPPLTRLTSGAGRMWHTGLSATAAQDAPSAPALRLTIEPGAQDGETLGLYPGKAALKTPDAVGSLGPAGATLQPNGQPAFSPQPQSVDMPPSVKSTRQDRPPLSGSVPAGHKTPAVSRPARPSRVVASEPNRSQFRPFQIVSKAQEFVRRLLFSQDIPPKALDKSGREKTSPRAQSHTSVTPRVHPSQKSASTAQPIRRAIMPNASVHVANIYSLPEAATVTIDGKTIGTTPLTANLALGTHTIEVRKRGYAPERYDVTFRKAGTSTLHNDLHLQGGSH